MIKKMLKTWLSNLIQKNPVSGKSLMIQDKDADLMINLDPLSEDYQHRKTVARLFIDEIMSYFDIINRLKYRILPVMEMYGDCFVEIINLNTFNPGDSKDKKNAEDDVGGSFFLGESSIVPEQGKIGLTRNILTETQKIDNLLKKTEYDNFSMESVLGDLADIFVDSNWDENEAIIGESLVPTTDRKEIILREKNEYKNLDTSEFIYEYVQNSAGELKPFLKFKTGESLAENSQPEKKRGRPRKKIISEQEDLETTMKKMGMTNKIDMSNILMLIHKPTNIVILQTSYGSKLGYVEVADIENVQSTNITQQLSTIIGRIISVSNNGTNSQEEILSRLVRKIIQKVVDNAAGNQGKNSKKKDIDKVLKSLDPEVYNTIKKLIIETDKDNPRRNTFRKLKARFIPIERMFQYSVPSIDYFPYGQSFIDPLVLQSKLYILSQLSNIIMKLSRAAPVRKWIVD